MEEAEGDGYCFLNAVENAVYKDHGYTIDRSYMVHSIFSELEENAEVYSQFHTGGTTALISDAGNFFSCARSSLDVVDLVVASTANALKLNLMIFQEKDGKLQLLKMPCHTSTKHIWLQYSKEEVEHYDAVVPVSKSRTNLIGGSHSHSYAVKMLAQFLTSDGKVPCITGQVVEVPSCSTVVKDEKKPIEEIAISSDEDLQFDEEPIPLEKALQRRQLNNRQREKFHRHMFSDTKAQFLPQIPEDIDGQQLIKISCKQNEWLLKQSDWRNFLMASSSRKGFTGIRKVGWCQGTMVCTNPDCTFYNSCTTHNQSYFTRKDKGNVCFSCGLPGKLQLCWARKLTEFSKEAEVLTIYHQGNHTCQLKIEKSKFDSYMSQVIKDNPDLTPSQAARAHVSNAVCAGNIEEAFKRAEGVADTKRYAFLRKQQKKSLGPTTQSIEAIMKLKESCKDIDPFFIYKVNMEGMNEGPTFVFKTSRQALQIAMDMDINSTTNNPLKEEEAFFDGQHSRVKNFKTLSLFTLHPAMKKLVRIASMEVKSESTQHIAYFWLLLNEALAEYSGIEGYKFNPITIIVDEAGANFCGIKEVYGEEFVKKRVIGCQMHYMANVNEHSRRLPHRHDDNFREACKDAMHSTTSVMYHQCLRILQTMAEAFPVISHFIQWWDIRPYHVFDAFRDMHFQ